MNTKDGYSKLTLDNTLVLLANGETKTISSIISNVANADTVDGYHGYEFIRKDTYTTITFNDNLYLQTSSTNIGSVVSNQNWKYVLLSVKKGDKFLIKGDGGSSPRLWAFADTSNVIKQKADSEQNYASYQTITANLDGYLIVNFDKTQSPAGDLVPISWVSGFLNKADTKIDNGIIYINGTTITPVTSVNGNTGAVTLTIPQTWVGTLSLYDAITSKDSDVFYFIIE